VKKFIALAALMSVFSVAHADTVKIDGSSTVFPITEGIAEDFQKANKGLKVTVGVSGTGGGFKKFCRGEIDISNASRPITQKEIDACKEQGITYYELPVAFDALTVVISPRNTFIKQLTPAELKTLWSAESQGKVTRWNQVNPSFPDQPISLFGPGADSGTFDYFTEAINGKSKSSRGDFTASEDDNVLVQGVSNNALGLAYFGYAYFAENASRLKAVPIVNSDGKTVSPSETSVMDGSYNPLSRPIFIYVNAASLNKPEVKQFIEYFMKHAAEISKEVKYVPLPSKVYAANLQHIQKGRVGTIFGGKNKVGLTVEQLVTMEVK
jgi:phosphate transport system substrate-binding protein